MWHTELNQQILTKKGQHVIGLGQFLYVLWPSSNELKSHMEDIISLIIMLLKSEEGFGSGKKHALDIYTKSYSNKLGAICTSVQVIKQLEIGLNLENIVLSNL